MATKTGVKKLETAVSKAEQNLEKARAEHEKILAKISEKASQVERRRSSMGQAVINGEALEIVAADVSHGNREIETLQAAQKTADEIVKDMEAAYKDVKQAYLMAKIDLLHEQGQARIKEVIGPMIPQLDALAPELLDLREQAWEAYNDMPFHRIDRPEEKHNLERKIHSIGLMGRANQFRMVYRSYAE